MSKSIKKNILVTKIITYIGLIIGLFYASFPVVWMLFSSIKSNTEIFSIPPKLFPEVLTFSAYQSIF
ncbi:MAG: carbohydrate ABC transporter permease, partial [Spirochaetia bacterium]|nr:carbohydrate ABC transporter permease [Spirochaetia bacterium]